MGVDHIPPVDRAPARLRDEPGTPAVEPQERPPPIAPSGEDRWERSDPRPEDQADRQPPPDPEGEEEEKEEEEEEAGRPEADDKSKHLDARA
ncbi:MAG TPA: hypothetical protein VMY87_11040 [Armatimonadota bacterium]|nr:hypothetical protein [Armatimonadota bacterium]